MKLNSKDISKSITNLELYADQVLKMMPRITTTLSTTGQRPLFIEFSGTPKSGKTTCAGRLELFLRRNNFKVRMLTERASTCPISKKTHISFNTWTACMTLAQMLEATDGSEQVIIIDRGIFDALWWMDFHEKRNRLSPENKEKIYNFLLLENWRKMIDIVFLLKTSPQSALNRECTDLLTHKPGEIMNETTLKQINESIDSVYKSTKSLFRCIIPIDTTGMEVIKNVEIITRKTLEALHNFIDEEVVVIRKKLIQKDILEGGLITNSSAISSITGIIRTSFNTLRRSNVENDSTYLQIVPCGIIKFKDTLLFLRRHEESQNHRMHNKYTVWAGGHMRMDDLGQKDPLLGGLNRELAEELLIESPLAIKRIALVLDNSNFHSSLHLGVVYLVEVNSPNVAIALDQKEFKERKGKSLSGKFLSLNDISKEHEGLDSWSYFILKNYFNVPLPGPVTQLSFNYDDLLS